MKTKIIKCDKCKNIAEDKGLWLDDLQVCEDCFDNGVDEMDDMNKTYDELEMD